MRLGAVLGILVFVAIGVLFGALNAERITLDLYFIVLDPPKGAAVLVALLIGWLLGGLVAWFGRVPKLKRELRAARRALREGQGITAPAQPPSDGTVDGA